VIILVYEEDELEKQKRRVEEEWTGGEKRQKNVRAELRSIAFRMSLWRFRVHEINK